MDAIPIDHRQIAKIRDFYRKLKSQGELDKTLVKLLRKQKNATTTNGPHPHHQTEQSVTYGIPSGMRQTQQHQPSKFS
ncbi:MAG: hypothetical protein ACMG6E_07515 [Candidatus Roizmanbacteria bacterium]